MRYITIREAEAKEVELFCWAKDKDGEPVQGKAINMKVKAQDDNGHFADQKKKVADMLGVDPKDVAVTDKEPSFWKDISKDKKKESILYGRLSLQGRKLLPRLSDYFEDYLSDNNHNADLEMIGADLGRTILAAYDVAEGKFGDRLNDEDFAILRGLTKVMAAHARKFSRMNLQAFATSESIKKESSGEIIELFGISPKEPDLRARISHAWTQGVMYKGQNVFELFYDDDTLMREVEGTLASEGYNETQECYLGYDTKKDLFYLGYDVWGETMDSNCGLVLTLKVDNGKAKVLGTREYSAERVGGMFYDRGSMSGFKTMDRNPDVVHVRLD